METNRAEETLPNGNIPARYLFVEFQLTPHAIELFLGMDKDFLINTVFHDLIVQGHGPPSLDDRLNDDDFEPDQFVFCICSQAFIEEYFREDPDIVCPYDQKVNF